MWSSLISKNAGCDLASLLGFAVSSRAAFGSVAYVGRQEHHAKRTALRTCSLPFLLLPLWLPAEPTELESGERLSRDDDVLSGIRQAEVVRGMQAAGAAKSGP
jgi:hypothetical protein